MFQHVLITLIIVHNCHCILENHGEYFIINDYMYNDTVSCEPLNKEQYYLNSRNNTLGFAAKLECIPENLERNKYFPKCCPPNYAYQAKHHKCLLTNATNMLEDFRDENLLIRTDLSECKAVVDHLVNISSLVIYSDRSLDFNNKIYRLGSYCLDNVYENEHIIIKTCENINVCKNQGVRCIKKCCPDGQYYEGNKCHPGHYFGLSLKNITRFDDRSEYFNGVLISDTCKRYIDKPSINFYIEKDGTTVIRELGVWKQYKIDENYYCVEYVQKVKDYKLLLCNLYAHVESASKPMVKKVALILSCICLLLTLVGYLILPTLKNLIGRIIICYCICLFIAFSSLIWLQFDPIPEVYCDVFGFVIAFFFLAAFSWMTILSYEMWRVLGSMTTEYGSKSRTHTKRFLWYNTIGWSIPLAIIIFTLLDYLYYFLPSSIHITVGYRQCVFENNRSRGIYGYVFHFAIPCGLYLLINFVIFIKTIRYIYKVKGEICAIKALDTSEKRKRWVILNTDKERMKMVIRIFLVMGINFLFETFSSIFVDFSGNKTLEIIELILDAFNGLQGVFIFCIFLLKKKIWKSLKELGNLPKSSRKSSVATNSTEVVIHRNHL